MIDTILTYGDCVKQALLVYPSLHLISSSSLFFYCCLMFIFPLPSSLPPILASPNHQPLLLVRGQGGEGVNTLENALPEPLLHRLPGPPLNHLPVLHQLPQGHPACVCRPPVVEDEAQNLLQ